MLFVSPRPSSLATTAIYDGGYFTGAGAHGNRSDPGGYLANASGYLAHARELVKWVMSLTGLSDGRWLDVGCGPGYLVAAAQQAGFQAEGVDISKAACRHGREHLGLMLHESAADGLTAVVEPGFAVVSMVDLLSHLRELTPALSQALAVLAPSGVLFAGPFGLAGAPANPDVASLGIPEHLGFPSQASMAHLLLRLGFADLRFVPKPLTPSAVVERRFSRVPPWVVVLARRVVRRLPVVQSAAHGLAGRSLDPSVGYVIARRPGGQ